MKIDTKYYGEIDYTKDELVVFPDGLFGFSQYHELSYYVICAVKKDYLDGTVNLKCPLAINPDTRKGIQVILSNADYDYRHTLRSLLGKEIKEQDTKKGDK